MKSIKLGLSIATLLVLLTGQSFGQNTAVKTANGNWKVCLTVSQGEKDPDYKAVTIIVKNGIKSKKTSEVIMNNYKMTVAYNLKFKSYTVYNNKGEIILKTKTVAAARDAVKHTMYKALTGKSLLMYTQEIIGLKVPKTDKVYKVVVTLPDMQIREIIKKRWIEYLKSQVQPKSIRRFVNFYNSVEGSEIQLIKKK